MNLIERLLARKTGMADDRHTDPLCAEAANTIARLTRERDAARVALEIIAGKRQCVDNLMSNVEIALCALEQTVDK